MFSLEEKDLQRCRGREGGQSMLSDGVVCFSDEYRAAGVMRSFQQFLDNIFQPLFDVTLHPDTDPPLDQFLQSVTQ